MWSVDPSSSNGRTNKTPNKIKVVTDVIVPISKTLKLSLCGIYIVVPVAARTDYLDARFPFFFGPPLLLIHQHSTGKWKNFSQSNLSTIFAPYSFLFRKKKEKNKWKNLSHHFCNRIENAILIFLHRNIVIAGLFSPSLLLWGETFTEMTSRPKETSSCLSLNAELGSAEVCVC